jgi:histidyl-tRNA synthetase
VGRLREFHPDSIDRISAIAKAVGGVKLSPMLVRGFDYYTSTVFEFRHPQFRGSIGGGGRYDRLTEKFGGQPVPACGASIGFERLLLILAETPDAKAKTGKRLCVTVFDETLRAKTMELVADLRSHAIPGLVVDVYPGAGKLKAQFKYADSTKADYALIMGPDEAAQGLVKRKDLKTGTELLMSFDDLASSLSPDAA